MLLAVYILFFAGLATPIKPSSIKCQPCDVSSCKPIDKCENGIIWDMCHCCETCSKGLGEECGGPWNAYGMCAVGLKCLKDARECPFLFSTSNIQSSQSRKMCDQYIFNAIGRCVVNRDPEINTLKRYRFPEENMKKHPAAYDVAKSFSDEILPHATINHRQNPFALLLKR